MDQIKCISSSIYRVKSTTNMNKEIYISKLEEAYIEELKKYKSNYDFSKVAQEAFLSISSYIDVLRNIPEGQFSIVSATKAFFGIIIYILRKEQEEISFKVNNVLSNADEKNKLLKQYDELASLCSIVIYIKIIANMSISVDELILESEMVVKKVKEKRLPVSDYTEYIDKFHCHKADILMLKDMIGKHAILDDIVGKELNHRNGRNWYF